MYKEIMLNAGCVSAFDILNTINQIQKDHSGISTNDIILSSRKTYSYGEKPENIFLKFNMKQKKKNKKEN